MATRKRKFWNEGGIPELGENPPPKAPPAPINTVSVGPSTGTHVPERWHVYDEHDEPYRVGGFPWAGNEARAKVEAIRLTRETGRVWSARRVE